MAFFKSTNSGANWSTYTINATADSRATAVAVDPADEHIVYVGGYVPGKGWGFYKSTDGGANWTEIGSGVFSTEIKSIAVDRVTPSRLYAGTTYGGLYRSENSGANWTKVGTYGAMQIKINSLNTNELYIATSNGVYFSDNYGTTWTPFNDGLGHLYVSCLEWDIANKILYAGTMGGSAYKNGSVDQYFLTIGSTAGGTTTPAPGSYAYAYGTKVEVKATPNTHYVFIGWTGDATGAANPLTVTMNTHKSIAANFEPMIYPPQNFAGQKVANRSVFLAQYINLLTWQANPANSGITGYRLYLWQGSTWAVLADLGAEVFSFQHKNVKKDESYLYGIVAVTSSGRIGDPAKVTVK